ncbi:MAG: VWA domain-containing protein [Alphaproteobacteria bacterium]
MTATGAAVAGPAAVGRRAVGFVDHLRANDFAVGIGESAAALSLLNAMGPVPVAAMRQGLKTLLTGSHDEWQRFDDLFEAYWFGHGRVRTVTRTAGLAGGGSGRPAIWDGHLPDGAAARPGGAQGAVADDDAGEAAGRGRLVASQQKLSGSADLRQMTDPAELAAAEAVARRLAQAMRYRLSRRHRARAGAPRLDLRRTIRRNIGHGGEPLTLVGRERPDRPVRLVVFVDVSGSMHAYARVFLQFVRGLVGIWAEADAYLVHTRLVRVTDALRDGDPMRAMARLALMAEGFGGGTRLAAGLAAFNRSYARRAVNGRTVAVILSDGYDTDPPDRLAAELATLKQRVRRLVWLNPLLGWRDYAPVTRAMAAALPFIDHFAAAHSLDALAALEGELARL